MQKRSKDDVDLSTKNGSIYGPKNRKSKVCNATNLEVHSIVQKLTPNLIQDSGPPIERSVAQGALTL